MCAVFLLCTNPTATFPSQQAGSTTLICSVEVVTSPSHPSSGYVVFCLSLASLLAAMVESYIDEDDSDTRAGCAPS